MKNIAAIAAVAGTVGFAAAQVTVDVRPSVTSTDDLSAIVTVDVVASGFGVSTEQGDFLRVDDDGNPVFETVVMTDLFGFSMFVDATGPAEAVAPTEEEIVPIPGAAAPPVIRDGAEGDFEVRATDNNFGGSFDGIGAFATEGEFDPTGFEVTLFSFQVVGDGTGGVSEVIVTTAPGDSGIQELVFTASTGLVNDPIFADEGGYEEVVANGASITFVPTPGAVAVLGLGGLAAARRRR